MTSNSYSPMRHLEKMMSRDLQCTCEEWPKKEKEKKRKQQKAVDLTVGQSLQPVIHNCNQYNDYLVPPGSRSEQPALVLDRCSWHVSKMTEAQSLTAQLSRRGRDLLSACCYLKRCDKLADGRGKRQESPRLGKTITTANQTHTLLI